MIEVKQKLASGHCKNCREPITQTVGEWSPEAWHHDSNGRPECPGAPVAEPAQYVVTEPPPRNHTCPLPAVVTQDAVWRCPVCTVPWRGHGFGWDVIDWTYVGPTQPVRDEPQA